MRNPVQGARNSPVTEASLCLRKILSPFEKGLALFFYAPPALVTRAGLELLFRLHRRAPHAATCPGSLWILAAPECPEPTTTKDTKCTKRNRQTDQGDAKPACRSPLASSVLFRAFRGCNPLRAPPGRVARGVRFPGVPSATADSTPGYDSVTASRFCAELTLSR
jgi:hypothetical protein